MSLAPGAPLDEFVRALSFVYFSSSFAALGGMAIGHQLNIASNFTFETLVNRSCRHGCTTRIGQNLSLSDSPDVRSDIPIMYNGWFLGAAIGALGSIIAVDLWGRKTTMLVNCVIAVLGAIIMAIAAHAGYAVMHANINSVLLAIAVGRIIMGISTGALSTTIPIYIAEVSPASSRGELVMFYQLGITFGILVSEYLFGNHWSQILYASWNFSMQSLPCIVLSVGLFWLPRSPHWLLMHGRDQDARIVLRRFRDFAPERVSTEFRALVNHVSVQKTLDYRDMLALPPPLKRCNCRNTPAMEQARKGKIRGSFFIACGIMLLATLQGINAIVLYIPASTSTSVQDFRHYSKIVLCVVNVACTIFPVILVDIIGRRRMLLVGSIGMTISISVATILAIALDTKETWVFSYLIPMSFFVMFFASCWGGVDFVLVSEIFGTKHRVLGMGVSTSINWLSQMLLPLVLDENGGSSLMSWIGLSFDALPIVLGIFLVVNVSAIFFVLFFVPETRGINLANISAGATPSRDGDNSRSKCCGPCTSRGDNERRSLTVQETTFSDPLDYGSLQSPPSPPNAAASSDDVSIVSSSSSIYDSENSEHQPKRKQQCFRRGVHQQCALLVCAFDVLFTVAFMYLVLHGIGSTYVSSITNVTDVIAALQLLCILVNLVLLFTFFLLGWALVLFLWKGFLSLFLLVYSSALLAVTLTDRETIEAEDAQSTVERMIALFLWVSYAVCSAFQCHAIWKLNANRTKNQFFTKQGIPKSNFGFMGLDESSGLIDIEDLDFSHESRIGGGVSGVVFKGRWEGMKVAIKQINTGLDTSYLKMFRKEVRLLMQLRHPRVVRYYGYCLSWDNIYHYIVMELGECSLAVLLSEWQSDYDGDPPHIATESLRLAKQLATALKFLDGHHIIHGDLKPENALLKWNPELTSTSTDDTAHTHTHRRSTSAMTTSTRFTDTSSHYALRQKESRWRFMDIMICDFGVSRGGMKTTTMQARAQTAMGGGLQGTIPYMAPELFEGKPIVRQMSEKYRAADIQRAKEEKIVERKASKRNKKAKTALASERLEKVDHYAFAIVLWELLSACRAYRGVPPAAVIYKVLQGQRPEISATSPPESSSSDVASTAFTPRWFWDNQTLLELLRECWSHDPKSRPSFVEIELRIDRELQRQNRQSQNSAVMDDPFVEVEDHHSRGHHHSASSLSDIM